MKRKEFFQKLQGLYPKFPDQEAIKEYDGKLSKWKISSEKLDALFERITERRQFFPTIAEFSEDAAEIGVDTKAKPKDPAWILFGINGGRCAKKIKDPSVQKAPSVATGARLAIPPYLRSVEEDRPATLEEAREAFSRGFLESGGDPQKLEGYFRAILSKPKRKEDPIPDEVPV